MKLMIKMCVLTALLPGFMYAQSNILDQYVFIWPDGLDAVPTVHWMCYNLYKASTHWVGETDPGSTTEDYAASYDLVIWSADVNNFNNGVNAWSAGDTIVCFGSWDSAHAADPAGYDNNPNHKGYFWFFSDTIISASSQHWEPNDTLRVMPWPIVSQEWETDSVIVDIDNPNETDPVHDASNYDIAGYYIVLNAVEEPEVPAGTPASFTYDVGFFPVQDGPGDHTFCKYLPGDFLPMGVYNTLHAYYIVFRPEDPGYMTYYLSRNSNECKAYVEDYDIDEHENMTPARMSLCVAPSILMNRTSITYALTKTTPVTMSIYDASGQLMSLLVDGVKPAGEHTVVFDGNDLPSGIYFCTLQTPERQLREKLTILR